jgi:hypothetical protein
MLDQVLKQEYSYHMGATPWSCQSAAVHPCLPMRVPSDLHKCLNSNHSCIKRASALQTVDMVAWVAMINTQLLEMVHNASMISCRQHYSSSSCWAVKSHSQDVTNFIRPCCQRLLLLCQLH